MDNIRFHLTYGDEKEKFRTTVSLDSFLCEIFAIKLDEIPGTDEAYTAIRKELQRRTDDSGSQPTSKSMRQFILIHIMRENLRDKLFDYWKS